MSFDIHLQSPQSNVAAMGQNCFSWRALRARLKLVFSGSYKGQAFPDDDAI
jgi:hypothetical protein